MRILLLVLVGCVVTAHAQSKADGADAILKESERLKQQYHVAVAKALVPIRERYMTELKRLQEQAMRAGNLDGANALSKEIENIKEELLAGSESKEDFETRILGTSWSWNAPNTANPIQILIQKKPLATKFGEFAWKTSRPYTIKYTYGTNIGVITFDRELTSATVEETTTERVTTKFGLTRVQR